MVYLFVLAVGFLSGVFATCLLLAFWERDTRRAGDVLDFTAVRGVDRIEAGLRERGRR